MNSKTLNPVRKQGEDLIKKCKVTKVKISINSDTCQYFNPVNTFYCDVNRQRLYILNCLQRRLNEKNLERLVQSNETNRAKYEIMTYDDLIDRAITLLNNITITQRV